MRRDAPPPLKANSTSATIRLNKYIASAGVCSRRKADELIQTDRVKVNGKVVHDLGVKITPSIDTIVVDGKQILILDEHVYILFNKPKDCITTTSDERGRTTIMDYVRSKQRIFPIGRLDRDTTGVLLLTNDGDFSNQLMHPRSKVKKAYKVTLDKALSLGDIQKLSSGIRLSDGMTEPSEVYPIPGSKNKVIGIVIHEGRNRQVHRMFESLGYDVKKLDRVAYGDITYVGVARGQWRYLTNQEIKQLRANVE